MLIPKREVVEDVDPVRIASEADPKPLPEKVKAAFEAASVRRVQTGGVAPPPKGPPQAKAEPSPAAVRTTHLFTEARERSDD